MNKRKFITLAGGGIVIAASAATGSAAHAGLFSSALPSAAVEVWQGPKPGLDAIRAALSYAITAPNPHNLQPWIADLREPNTITIRTDPTRVLPHTDPFGRQITIGHGAFLELLVMALAALGIAATVQLWPAGEMPASLSAWDDRPVAVLRLSPSPAKIDPLFAQILKRGTPKSDYDTSRAVAPEQLQALLAQVQASTIQSAGTVAADKVDALRQLCWQAAQVEINTPNTVMESIQLVRVGPAEILKHRDGISVNTPLVRTLTALGMFDRTEVPQPGSAGHKNMSARFEGHSRTAMGFAWLSGPNTRSGQIAAGRAHVRMHLKATEMGLGLHPMSQALQEFPQMQTAYAQAHQLTLGKPAPTKATDDTLHMLNRLGFLPQTTAPSLSPRRELGAFLRV